MRWLCVLGLMGCATSSTRLEVPRPKVDVKDGDNLRERYWTLTTEVDPDVYSVGLNRGERREICFVGASRSFCRTVGIGDRHDFVIRHAGRDYRTRITGEYKPPAARFDEAYRRAYRGKTRVSIPEVYELVNIAIALSATAEKTPNLVFVDTPYHAEVQAHFAAFKQHPFVLAIDAALVKTPIWGYYAVKMNAHAFEMEGDLIVRSRVFDRTGWSDENALLPHLAAMQDFARATRFRAFYASHRPLYDEQVEFIRDRLGVEAMMTWLRAQFPDEPAYDSVNIVFSPLVGFNQSLITFESNGFRELQPHVNFPYPAKSTVEMSAAGNTSRRGLILFTELNHGFIRRPQEPFTSRLAALQSTYDKWLVGRGTKAYENMNRVFKEMMNWALFSLYFIDTGPPEDVERMLIHVETQMTEKRGFVRFAAFHRHLVALYRARPPGATVASLYPQMVDWIEKAARED
jgi:hypothetical protein